MTPQVEQNASVSAVEKVMDEHRCPVVMVLTPGGYRYAVNRERLHCEFIRGHFEYLQRITSCDAICTVGAIRFAALKYCLEQDWKSSTRPVGPLETFPWDALTESLKGRAHFVYRGVVVIREEGEANIHNPFRFV
jgi:hypothetical protein